MLENRYTQKTWSREAKIQKFKRTGRVRRSITNTRLIRATDLKHPIRLRIQGEEGVFRKVETEIWTQIKLS